MIFFILVNEMLERPETKREYGTDGNYGTNGKILEG
jgi:hypothetical protein